MTLSPSDWRRWLLPLVRVGFRWLYHQGAWAYDGVAWLVSLGRWQDWVRSMALWPEAQPGAWVLELGFGPGYLQLHLAQLGFRPMGVDPSPAMARRARDRLRRAGFPPRLVQGRAQKLPFPSESFHRVVATFPAEYIFEEATLREVWRVLRPGGRFDVLLSAAGGILSWWERLWSGSDLHQTAWQLHQHFQMAARWGAQVYVRRYPLPRGSRGWAVTLYKPASLEDMP